VQLSPKGECKYSGITSGTYEIEAMVFMIFITSISFAVNTQVYMALCAALNSCCLRAAKYLPTMPSHPLW
jgi:hypothetical protein